MGLEAEAAKRKVLTLTLRRAPIVATYMIGGVVLERVRVMRDLGVMLDEKLAFGEHVDYAVRKANRALGLLMRTLQTGKNGRHLKTANQCDLLSAYYANVRSILEYGGVVRDGTTESHIQRMERIQEKFLVWLCAGCRVHGVSLSYQDLAAHFGVSRWRARMQQCSSETGIATGLFIVSCRQLPLAKMS